MDVFLKKAHRSRTCPSPKQRIGWEWTSSSCHSSSETRMSFFCHVLFFLCWNCLSLFCSWFVVYDKKKIIAWLSLNFTLETSWVALYSDVCQSVSLSGIGVTQPNLYLFQYIKAFKPLLTLYHLKPISSNLYWPSTSQYRHILIQYHL